MTFSKLMLDWYDIHARKLPWRIAPYQRQKGIIPNPYHVWLSEIMLQQTTVATVKAYFEKFIKKWPTIHDLANADIDSVMSEWAGLGYYSRARNLHKTAQEIVFDYNGQFPQNIQQLLSLSGIGSYSAASISSIAFDISAPVMDGNIERIISRLYRVNEFLPKAKKQLYDYVQLLTPQERAGDYAQAMMDLGATICTPKKPLCQNCPIQTCCEAFQYNDAENYPKKLPKVKKPTYYGAIFLVQNKDSFIVEKRPDRGLFGGMEIFPYFNPHEDKKQIISMGNPVDKIVDNFIDKLENQSVINRIRHVFTHFTLIADIVLIQGSFKRITSNQIRLVHRNNLDDIALPTLMTKAINCFDEYKKATQLSLNMPI